MWSVALPYTSYHVVVARRYAQQTADQRRAERRARLVEAAVAAFGTRGYFATSIEQLCSDAGISTRNFYDEFASREALLAALHDMLNERAMAAVVDALADVEGLEDRAVAGVRAYFEVMTEDPRWARIAVVESVGVSPAMEAHRNQALARFASLIQGEADRLAALGVIPRRDHSLTAIALVGAINGLINLWAAGGDRDAAIDDVVSEAARLIVAALRA
jgi:AcrR family transcriptional regulator